MNTTDSHTDTCVPRNRLSKTARRYAERATRMGIDNPEDLMDFAAAQERPLDEHLPEIATQDVQAGTRRPTMASIQDQHRVPGVVQ